ncbi:MAG: glycosyltransferase [Caldilineaceae bacterium]|nr:glycosyltransferase [Caldilineaceae bacterium]
MPLSLDALALFTTLFQLLYGIGALGLALYGGQALWLTWQFWRRTDQQSVNTLDLAGVERWPYVTIQLPVYNEQHVIERLIDACTQIQYPAHRLQIQVLDDSTDQTTTIARQRSLYWRQRGLDVQVLHRTARTGYKAGALGDALPQASGDFIAIFDADFVPPVDFLRRTIPPFLDPNHRDVGFVQARWGHINADYSPLTRCQALALDGHFVVEQPARQAAGYPFGFNGSAGVWRRACIEDRLVGGWQDDTLCEDLDLSYRAQLAGWQPLYLPDLEVPAEVPPQLLAFKRQQFRWAKGSVQTLKKLIGTVWQSGWSWPARLSATFHLGNYLIHPLLLLLLLVMLPLLLFSVHSFWPLTYLSLVSLGPPLLYAVAQRRLYGRGWLRRWSYLPMLTLLGMGLCLSNSVAVWQALRRQETPFLRTPKFQIKNTGDRWQRSAYALTLEPMMVGELLLCLYACTAIAVAIYQQNWWAIPFMSIYAAGFALMVGAGIWQAFAARRAGNGQMGREGQAEAQGEQIPGLTAVDLVKSQRH